MQETIAKAGPVILSFNGHATIETKKPKPTGAFQRIAHVFKASAEFTVTPARITPKRVYIDGPIGAMTFDRASGARIDANKWIAETSGTRHRLTHVSEGTMLAKVSA